LSGCQIDHPSIYFRTISSVMSDSAGFAYRFSAGLAIDGVADGSAATVEDGRDARAVEPALLLASSAVAVFVDIAKNSSLRLFFVDFKE
jgi:hypothetical protein